MKRKHHYVIEWRVREMMVKRGVRSVGELHARVSGISDMKFSKQHLYRVVSRPPTRVNTHLLANLMLALDCDMQDIFMIRRIGNGQPPNG